MRIKTKRLAVPAALAAAAALAVGAVGCGDDDTTGTTAKTGAGNKTDAAFVADMVPHHRSAIEMAEVAATKAEHPEIKTLAAGIVSSQQAEVSVLERIGDDLHQMGVAAGHMEMSEDEMGMTGDAAMLDTAKPFDRAFIDMMIPHHEGAVRMARAVLADGEQPALRKVAEAIVAAQTAEIEQMRMWRKEWYGSDKADPSESMSGHGDSMTDGE